MNGFFVSFQIRVSGEDLGTNVALELHRENDSKCLEHGFL